MPVPQSVTLHVCVDHPECTLLFATAMWSLSSSVWDCLARHIFVWFQEQIIWGSNKVCKLCVMVRNCSLAKWPVGSSSWNPVKGTAWNQVDKLCDDFKTTAAKYTSGQSCSGRTNLLLAAFSFKTLELYWTSYVFSQQSCAFDHFKI